VAVLVAAGLLIGLLVGLLPGKGGSSSSAANLDTQDVSQLQQLPALGTEAARKLLADPATPGGLCMSCTAVHELRCVVVAVQRPAGKW
jgi:hypothetical protein